MEHNEIDNYVYSVLKKQLQRLKVNNYGMYKILNNVKIQLYSVIKNWNDKEFINAIFMTVIEEGLFYEPSVDLRIRNMVVLCIRNSFIETIASEDYKDYGLKSTLSNSAIKDITSSAIKYFSEKNLDDLCQNINVDEDCYKQVINKYPSAYKALLELSLCSDHNLEREYTLVSKSPYIIEELKKNLIDNRHLVIENGISSDFNDALLNHLKGIEEERSNLFYIDSFKYLSRNFEKVLKVLEFVITHNANFLTNNFYIRNDYVSRRKQLIKAGHGCKFNDEAIKTISEVSIKYKEQLKKLEIQV